MSFGRFVIYALAVSWVVGLCSAVYIYGIDLDHPYCLLRDGIPITWEALSRQACRDWHFSIGAFTWLAFGVEFAYATGRAIILIKGVNNRTGV